MGDILNDLTVEQIKEYKRLADEKHYRVLTCFWCDKTFKAKSGKEQRFCSSAHRTAYARAAAKIVYDKLVIDKQVWLAERESFIKEISELRHRVYELESSLKKAE